VYELHGRTLDPRPGTQPPASAHVSWHRRQVFQGLPLAG
jgi:putative restriction endonuclease